MSDQTNSNLVKMLFSEFLETSPPNQMAALSDIAISHPVPGGWAYNVNTPDLLLNCASEICNGIRVFRSNDEIGMMDHEFNEMYLRYTCSNCLKTVKIYSIAAKWVEKSTGECYKYGEVPPFGPPTPARLITLIGPDRELFLKGRRCENQGLGIGAFIYYRRVVENQKNRILEEIAKVAEKLKEDPAIVTVLRKAIAETQFSKALEMVKDAVPKVILIDGNNPLTLLHRALSSGVHNNKDEECLEIAESIRIVLAELSERMAVALKDEDSLKKAISNLLK